MSHKAQIVLNKLLARVGIAVLHFFKVLFFLRGRKRLWKRALRAEMKKRKNKVLQNGFNQFKHIVHRQNFSAKSGHYISIFHSFAIV